MDRNIEERFKILESEIKSIKNSIEELYELVGSVCPTIPAITRAIIALDHRLPAIEESAELLQEITFRLPRKMYLSDDDLDIIKELFKVYFLDTGIIVNNWGERLHSRFLLEGLHYYIFTSGYQSDHTRELSKNTLFYTVEYEGSNKEYGSIDYFSWVVHKFKKDNIKDPSTILASLIYLINYTLHRYGTFTSNGELKVLADRFPCELPEALDICFDEWLTDIEPLNGSWLNEPCFNYLDPTDLVEQGYIDLKGLYLNPNMSLYDPISHTIKGFKNAERYIPHVCTTKDLDQRNFLIIKDNLPTTKHSDQFNPYPSAWDINKDLNSIMPLDVYHYIRDVASKYSDNTDCVYGDTFLLCTIWEYEGLDYHSLKASLPTSINDICIQVFKLNSEMLGVCIGNPSKLLSYVLRVLELVSDDYHILWNSLFYADIRLTGLENGKFKYENFQGNPVELCETEEYKYFEAWCKFPENNLYILTLKQELDDVYKTLMTPYDFSRHSCEVITVNDKQEIHLEFNRDKLVCNLYKSTDILCANHPYIIGVQTLNSSESLHHSCNLTVYNRYSLCSIILEFMYYFDTEDDVIKIEFENGILNVYVKGNNAGTVELLPKPGRKTTRKIRTVKSKSLVESSVPDYSSTSHTSMFNSNVAVDDVYL